MWDCRDKASLKGCKDPLAATRHARGSDAEVRLLEVSLWSDLGSSVPQGVSLGVSLKSMK